MSEPAANTLPKEERLHGKKDISALLAAGRWGTAGCLRYCAAPNDLGFSRILVSVPKRLFKRAVKRNLLKRRIREAYRVRKSMLGAEGSVDVMFQYISPEVQDFATVSRSVTEVLEKIAK